MAHWLKQVEEVVAGKRRYALIAGDCLDVGRRLPDASFDSCIIDPPYGMRYQGLEGRRPPIANDEAPFIWWLHDAYRTLKPDASLACFCNWKNEQAFKFAIETARFKVRNQVIWDRMNGGMGHTAMTFAPRHDVIWFASKGSFKLPNGRPDSVLPVSNVPPKRREHSTQKPDELMRRLVRALTPEGGIVYDPTMGSGSTGVAAMAEGCRFIGVELDPLNYATAKRRVMLAARSPRPPRACLARAPHATYARGAA